jgi:hypothetical protein
MKTVFADSFYFFALANPNDPAHDRAVAFVKTFSGRMVTTGWVLTELADGWAKPTQRTFVVPMAAKLRASSGNSSVGRVASDSRMMAQWRPLLFAWFGASFQAA